jgi:hypothetical protein
MYCLGFAREMDKTLFVISNVSVGYIALCRGFSGAGLGDIKKREQ